MNKTTDVHQALSNAVLREKSKVASVNANFKINPIHKEMAEQICGQHGTTLSSFLRECVSGLIKDYVGEKAVKELEL